MTEDMTMPNIIPYFILQYVDQRSKIYRGYIVAADAGKNENGEIVYDYKIDTNIFLPGWRTVGKFYALNPLFRPIPTGMNLYCVEHSNSSPMRISAFYKDYDIFNINRQNCTYFITYGQPVLNTASLYFHDMGENGLFPSHGRDPPCEKELPDVKFSPIFVMTSFSMHINEGTDLNYDTSIRFRCLNKKCVPWTDLQPEIYKTKDLLAQKSIPIFDCVVSCNQNLIENEIDKDTVEGQIHSPKSILSVVKGLNTTDENVRNDVRDVVESIIGPLMVVFLATMIVLIVIILRKHGKI